MELEDREIVGSVERVLLERLRVRVPCRIDTGARSSALHVHDLVVDGDDHVSFVVRGKRGRKIVEVEAAARVLRWGDVRSPTGGIETRAFVRIRIGLGADRFPIEVGLTARDGMRYPMLLGRSALAGRYLVDVARRFALSNGGAS